MIGQVGVKRAPMKMPKMPKMRNNEAKLICENPFQCLECDTDDDWGDCSKSWGNYADYHIAGHNNNFNNNNLNIDNLNNNNIDNNLDNRNLDGVGEQTMAIPKERW